MAQLDAAFEQRLFEGKRAADDETHQVIAPEFADVLRLGNEFAVPPHPVARQVSADVEIRRQGRNPPVAGRRVADQRTRFRIELAEAQKIGGERIRQNGKVPLHIAGRHTRRRAAMTSGADRKARRQAAANGNRLF